MNRLSPILRQSLHWCAILIILLLSMATPLIVLSAALIMVPMLVLYLKLDLKQFSLAYVSSLFVLFVLLGGGGFVLVMFSLFFIPSTVAMGQLYKKSASIKTVVVVGILVMIAEILLLLLLGYLTGADPVGQLQTQLTHDLGLLPERYHSLIATGYVEKITLALPLLLLLFTTIYVMLTHTLTRRLLRKSATPISGLPPMHEWKMPKSLVWYFIILLVIGMFITEKSDLYYQMMVVNLLPLFTLLFFVQAVGLIYAFVHYKRWPRIIPLLMILMSLYMPFLYLACLLGIMDILMPLRQRFFKL